MTFSEDIENETAFNSQNGIPYKNVILEFPKGFALQSIIFKNFTNGKIILEVYANTFRQVVILQDLSQDFSQPTFDVFRGIDFSFNLSDRGCFKVLSYFKEIFAKLKFFKIAEGNDHPHSAAQHFVKFLEEGLKI